MTADHAGPSSSLREAMEAESLRLHLAAASVAAAASLVATLVLSGLVLRFDVDRAAWLAWLAAMAAAMAVRLGVARAHGRAAPALSEQEVAAPAQFRLALARWLARYRLAYLLHGVAWTALFPVMAQLAPGAGLGATALVVSGMVGGSVITGAFDVRAAAAFALPAAGALFARLLGLDGAAAPELAVATAFFLLLMALAGQRFAQLLQQKVRAELDLQARVRDAQRHAQDAEQARRRLAESLQLQQQLLHDTPQGYWFIDREGRTVDVNPAMCRMLGRSREELLGLGVFDVFAGAEREVLERQLALRRDGQAGGYEVDIVRRDGSRVHAYNQATPVHDAAGQPVGSVGLWTDLTARRQLELELRTYERVTNSISEMVSVVGRDHRYRLVNDAWSRTLGISREDALGRVADRSIITMTTPERLAAMEACLRDGLPSTVVSPVRLPDGREVILQTRFYPYRDSSGLVPAEASTGVMMITRDVTNEERAVAALSEREMQQRALLDAFPGFISVFDNDLNFVYVNGPLALLAGRPQEALLGLHVSALVGRKRAALLQQEAVRVRAGERVVFERDYRGPGRELTVQTTLAAGRDPRSNEPVLYAFGVDISDLKRAEGALRASEAEMRAVLQAFPGYIAAADNESRYVFANERFARMLDLAPEDLLHRQAADVLGAARGAVVRAELDKARRGEVVRAERSYTVRQTQESIDLEVTHVAGPVGPGGAQVVYTFGLDITARKRAQAALAAARDEADRANRAKSQFLSHMSHELRTPMNAVLGFAQLLRRDARPPLAAHQQGYVQQILRGASHLLELINEVLDLGRIEAGQLHLEPAPVAAAELLANCQDFVGELARARGVELLPLRVSDAPLVLADRTRLRQVLLNLLGNAIKYNRPRGQVQISCRRDGEQVLFEVRDTGPGISAEMQGRLFQPFERLGAERGSTEGTGIGLALCKRLVGAMNGFIGLRSEPGVGSTFWVRLPVADAAGAATSHNRAAAPEAPQVQQPLKVLCIDDNEINLLLVEGILERVDGIRVLTAQRPVDGLKLAQSERPALVLLDIHMPGMDGFEVLARLRSQPATARTPVVAVSADASPADLEAARAAGFAAYLTKPLDLDQLQDTVRRLSQPGQEAADGAT